MKTNLLPVVGAAALLAGCVTVKKPAYGTLIAHRGESVDALTTNCAKKLLDEYEGR